MRLLAEPLVRAAVGAVREHVDRAHADQPARVGPRNAACAAALWDMVCTSVDIWADSADGSLLRDFLQVRIAALDSETHMLPRPVDHDCEHSTAR